MMCCLHGVFLPYDAFGKPWGAGNTNRPSRGRIMGDYFLGFIQWGAVFSLPEAGIDITHIYIYIYICYIHDIAIMNMAAKNESRSRQ